MEFINELPAQFCERMKCLLGGEYDEFMQGYDAPKRRGLRVNTLKCSVESLIRMFPAALTPSPFSPFGFYMQEEHRAGADPLHHAGAYYMQEPSAMSAVTVLCPRPGERVLDLCAAPGGKSTQIAAALQGQGLLWANEFVRSRARILAQNIERCGVRNAVVSNADVHTVCSRLTGLFDAVLVDAPCSGEGMFRKEPDALRMWSEDNIQLCARRQQEILDEAAQAVRPGGRMVYSTCTFAPEENECQIARFLTRHTDFELLPIPDAIGFGVPGFSAERVCGFGDISGCDAPLAYTRRIFPGAEGEGHFVALLQKRGDSNRLPAGNTLPQQDEQAAKLFRECFDCEPYGVFMTTGNLIRLLPFDLPPLQGLGVLAAGVAVAEICKNRLEPCHSIYMAAGKDTPPVSRLSLALDDERLTAYLRGETVDAPGCSSWTAVEVEGITTGFGKASGGILKNRYPKGLRLLG